MKTKYYPTLKQAHEDQQKLNNLSSEDLKTHVNNKHVICVSLEGLKPTHYHLALRGSNFQHLGTYQTTTNSNSIKL